MVDIMFSAASRLMRMVGSFACAPRKSSRLPVNVSVTEASYRSSGGRRTISMAGWLKDISETGVGMIVPNIRMGDCYFTGVDRRLRIAIEMAGGPVLLSAAPVRYEKIEADSGASVEYLIGAQITEMSAHDRARFSDYL